VAAGDGGHSWATVWQRTAQPPDCYQHDQVHKLPFSQHRNLCLPPPANSKAKSIEYYPFSNLKPAYSRQARERTRRLVLGGIIIGAERQASLRYFSRRFL
jgi:hypothetical protein